ncbi:MAG TPA: ferric reductase-like transmembrane domain-containing protein [Solirubrobacteraceae bacterium]|nr:ferric reductase-like transmembrane domain-containing protein [Solirubrobacteraceae bacterium]
MLIAAASHPIVLWYATRATGVVALVLLTLATSLGLLNRSGVHSERWPRFLIHAVHRRAALLSVVFLGLHIVTTVLDGYEPISWLDSVIPFLSPYRTFWLGLGTVACDLLLAVWITSLLRARLGYRAWRAVHWLAYGCWPVALIHGIGIGTDAGQSWMLALDVVCVASVLVAASVRYSGVTVALRASRARQTVP